MQYDNIDFEISKFDILGLEQYFSIPKKVPGSQHVIVSEKQKVEIDLRPSSQLNN